MSTTKEFIEKLSIEKKTKRPFKIGLMGPFGGNLGDAAIQQAMLQNIDKFLPNSEVFGFSLDPQDTETRHGIPSFPINRVSDRKGWWLGKNPSALTRELYDAFERLRFVSPSVVSKIGRLLVGIPLELIAIHRAYENIKYLDIFIVSGGGQLDDYWYGPWFHPYTLLLWAALAKLAGVKFFIVSVGAGPLSAKTSRLFTRLTLALADYCSYRDQDSKCYIELVLGKAHKGALVFPDLAHSLKVSVNQNQTIFLPCQKLIGIGPIPYFNPLFWPEKDKTVYLNYLEKLAEFIDWLLENQYKVMFLIGEFGQDKPAIEDLKSILKRNKTKYLENQIIEESITGVDALVNCIDKTEAVVSSRFHGVLLAQLLNKPVLALSYHRKIDMLMADTGQLEYCLQINNFDVKIMKEKFSLLETKQNTIKQQLEQKKHEYQDALNKQYGYLFKEF